MSIYTLACRYRYVISRRGINHRLFICSLLTRRYQPDPSWQALYILCLYKWDMFNWLPPTASAACSSPCNTFLVCFISQEKFPLHQLHHRLPHPKTLILNSLKKKFPGWAKKRASRLEKEMPSAWWLQMHGHWYLGYRFSPSFQFSMHCVII